MIKFRKVLGQDWNRNTLVENMKGDIWRIVFDPSTKRTRWVRARP